MAISVEGVRRGYQYGVGEIWQPDDLPFFGWFLLKKEQRKTTNAVVVRRPIAIGEDEGMRELEKQYFHQYEKMEKDIKNKYFFGQLFASIFFVLTFVLSILYFLSGTLDSVAVLISELDLAIKTVFTFAGESSASIIALVFRFLVFACVLISVAGLIINKVMFDRRMAEPLLYYEKSAEIIDSCLKKAAVRASYLRSRTFSAKPVIEEPIVTYDDEIAKLGVKREDGKSTQVPVSIPVGDREIKGTVDVPQFVPDAQ